MRIVIRAAALFLAFILIVPSVSAAGTGTGAADYAHTVELQNGFYYKNEISRNSSGSRVETYKLDLRNGSAVTPIVLSADRIANAMTVDEVTAYATDLGYTVFGAVNADFFSMQTSVPLGIVVENGIYKSSPSGYNALVFNNEGAAVVENAEVTMRLSNGRNGAETMLEHLNKHRHEQFGIYVYTDAFSETTETFSEGWAVRCSVLEGEMRIGGEVKLIVSGIIENGYNYPLRAGEVLLTASSRGTASEGYKDFELGDELTLAVETGDPRLESAIWATGCGNILVSEGAVTDDKTWDSALFGSHPRTAVGVREDGSCVTYTVDGRNSAHSAGARLSEVAKDLIDEGCVVAVNMDGGGSTALNVKLPGCETAVTVDEPSSVRRCSTYILFVRETDAAAGAEKLFLAEDGAFILSGARLTLHYFRTNGLLDSLGESRTMALEAPAAPGAYRGPDGGIVYAVTAGDCDISVLNTDVGGEASLSDLESGSSVQLAVSVRYLGREVLFDPASAKYTASGCALADENGLVTVLGSAGDTGSVTVSLAGFTDTLDASVPLRFEDTRSHWAKDYIDDIFREGIVNGYPDGGFHADDSMTRANFTLMLYRAMGEPAVTGEMPFEDVTPDKYYHNAVEWAKESSVAVVRDESVFEPEADIPREEAFTMLARAFGFEGTDPAVLDRFSDSTEIDPFALDAVAALCERGVVVGSGGTLFPKSTITRGEMSKIIALAMFGK